MIFVASFLLYGNTLNHDYTQDDAIVIYDNMFTTQGFKGIPGLLTNDTFYGFFKEKGKANLVSGGRYRPLTPIMFAVEYEFFGRKPFYGHMFNVFWYALLGIMIFITLKSLFKGILSNTQADLIAFIAAMLFVAHPLHTEVVANIKGRDEIISMLGAVVTLWLTTINKSHYLHKGLIALIFFLACLSKENAITFLAVIPLAHFMFLGKSVKETLTITIAPLIGALVFLAIRTSILGFDLGSEPMELMNNPYLKLVGNQYMPFSFEEKYATIATTLLKYLQLLVFPAILTHDYYPRHIDIMSFSQAHPILSILTYTALIGIALFSFKKNKIIAFSIMYFIITLSIVSNLFFPVGTNMSERFMFMPSLGFVIFLAYLLHIALSNYRITFISIFLSIFILYSYKSISRNQVWKDDFTLFTTDVKTSKNSAKVLNAAGGALSSEANKVEDKNTRDQMLNMSINYLTQAIEIHPTYKNAYLIMGNAHYFLGQYQEAVNSYNVALQLDPNYKDAEKNLAISLRDLGRIAGEKEQDLEKSIKYLNQSLALSNIDPETYRLLGIAHGIGNDHIKAIQYFKKVIDLSPNAAGGYLNLSNAYSYTGDSTNARLMMEKALSLDPNINK